MPGAETKTLPGVETESSVSRRGQTYLCQVFAALSAAVKCGCASVRLQQRRQQDTHSNNNKTSSAKMARLKNYRNL